MATELDITRAKLASYESEHVRNPPLEDLIKFSEYFKMSIDSLIKVNLNKLMELQLRELEAGNDLYVTGTKIRILPITVTPNGREHVTYVSQKAKAGYLNGHQDPEFIAELPSFHLPHLPKGRTYRMFTIEGDSMMPIPHGSNIVAEYIENWKEIKDGTLCMVISKDDGMAFKMVYNQLKKNQTLKLHSLNAEFEDYEISADNLLEVWKFVEYSSNKIPEATGTLEMVLEEVRKLKKVVNRKSI